MQTRNKHSLRRCIWGLAKLFKYLRLVKRGTGAKIPWLTHYLTAWQPNKSHHLSHSNCLIWYLGQFMLPNPLSSSAAMSPYIKQRLTLITFAPTFCSHSHLGISACFALTVNCSLDESKASFSLSSTAYWVDSCARHVKSAPWIFHHILFCAIALRRATDLAISTHDFLCSSSRLNLYVH